MMYRFLAPELSAQFITAATGKPSDMRNLLPAAPPRPRLDAMVACSQQAVQVSCGIVQTAGNLTLCAPNMQVLSRSAPSYLTALATRAPANDWKRLNPSKPPRFMRWKYVQEHPASRVRWLPPVETLATLAVCALIPICISAEAVSQELGIALRLPSCWVHHSMQSLQRAGRLLRQLSMQAEVLALAAAPASRMTVSAAESSSMASLGLVTRLGSAEAWCHGSGAAMPTYARSFGSSSLRER